MKKFRYVSYDMNNHIHKGIEYADTELELYNILYNRGEYVKKIKTALFSLDTTIKLKSRELSEFCSQLGTMLQSGIAISRALEVLKETLVCRKQVKLIYKDIHLSILEGLSLSQSILKTKAFPDLLINIIKASEENATLDKVLFQMSDYYERDVKISNKIKGAMIYPLLLIVVMITAVLVIFNVILPTFLKTLEELTELPTITKIVIGISDILTKYGFFILIGFVALCVIITFVCNIPIMKYQINKIKLKIPYIGKLLTSIYTYRFASTLSSMYLGGISIVNAVLLSSKTINNVYLETQLVLVRDNLIRGASLSSSLFDVIGFHKKLSASIKVGEETGELDSLLIKLSKSLEEDANSSVDRLLTLLEPLTIVLLGIVIVPIILAVMLPMLKMYSSVGVGM